MEDTGVIDIGPDEALFVNNKVDDAKNKQAHKKVHNKSDAPEANSIVGSLGSVHNERTDTDQTYVKQNISTHKNHLNSLNEHLNSTSEETFFSSTLPEPIYPSYSEYESYDYQEYHQVGDQVVSLPYDFSGLQFSQLSEHPRVWNSQDAFLEQVGLKLYMFIPAGIAGILLGVFLWIIAMIILRAYGVAKKAVLRFIQKENPQDFEMGPSNKSDMTKIHPESKQMQSDYIDSARVSQWTANEKESIQKDCIQKRLTGRTVISPSTQSSPVSLSSGIGTSERESGDERDSLSSCKELQYFGGARGTLRTRTVSEPGNRGPDPTECWHEKSCRRNSD